jgi:hypothetical protein
MFEKGFSCPNSLCVRNKPFRNGHMVQCSHTKWGKPSVPASHMTVCQQYHLTTRKPSRSDASEPAESPGVGHVPNPSMRQSSVKDVSHNIPISGGIWHATATLAQDPNCFQPRCPRKVIPNEDTCHDDFCISVLGQFAFQTNQCC